MIIQQANVPGTLFGNRLRQVREMRGWSRFRLVVEIRDQFRKDGLGITEMGIVLIENGTTKDPRGTTLAMLRKVMPELDFEPLEGNLPPKL